MADPLNEFEVRYGTQIVDSLGSGKDGSVFKTDHGTAVKFLSAHELYNRECRAYRVLKRVDLDEIVGHQIPRLVRFDDELLAIEMSIVAPPFLLDFASAYMVLEFERLGFSDEVLEEREQHWAEVFGERWPTVALLRSEFRRLTGLVLLDLSLNNIRSD